MPGWGYAAAAGAQTLGDILSMFGPGEDYGGGSAIGRDEWWNFQAPIWERMKESTTFGRELTPELMGHLRKALSGEMGLNPQALQQMGGRVKQQMAPQFAMQQDALKSSFSPRLAGSGAAGSAMQKLLGGQSQQMTGAQTDINIQDLLARFGMMGQGMGQMGQMWGQNQGMQNAFQNTGLRWLGM